MKWQLEENDVGEEQSEGVRTGKSGQHSTYDTYDQANMSDPAQTVSNTKELRS